MDPKDFSLQQRTTTSSGSTPGKRSSRVWNGTGGRTFRRDWSAGPESVMVTVVFRAGDGSWSESKVPLVLDGLSPIILGAWFFTEPVLI